MGRVGIHHSTRMESSSSLCLLVVLVPVLGVPVPTPDPLNVHIHLDEVVKKNTEGAVNPPEEHGGDYGDVDETNDEMNIGSIGNVMGNVNDGTNGNSMNGGSGGAHMFSGPGGNTMFSGGARGNHFSMQSGGVNSITGRGFGPRFGMEQEEQGGMFRSMNYVFGGGSFGGGNNNNLFSGGGGMMSGLNSLRGSGGGTQIVGAAQTASGSNISGSMNSIG